jgi:hypothetical protein
MPSWKEFMLNGKTYQLNPLWTRQANQRQDQENKKYGKILAVLAIESAQ